MTVAEWFIKRFLLFDNVVEVTVKKVDPDTAEVLATSTGVKAYKKGGASEEAGGAVRAQECQWRLLAGTIAGEAQPRLGFAVGPLNLVVEDDNTTWQVKPESKVAREVFDNFAVCQCSQVSP